MRRFFFGVVIASVTAAMPSLALGGDREIAKTVMAELQQHKDAGRLKGFDINLKVEDNVVYLTGEVATQEQRWLIERAAASAAGAQNVVNEITLKPSQSEEVQLTATTDSRSAPSRQDVAITDAIYDVLERAKAAGSLRGFELDISTVAGDVWIRGNVANEKQKALVIDAARRTQGVSRVIDDVTVASSSVLRTAAMEVSTPLAMPTAPMPVPQSTEAPQVPSMPMMVYMPTGMPQPMHPASYATPGHMGGGPVPMGGGPVPMQFASTEYGMGAPRYDQPNLPNYAWPSYAAHPNYAAVTYPKQYSPSAWPYIGPFYPYPQVPLGWRKVTLQWDDGLWHLDFTSK